MRLDSTLHDRADFRDMICALRQSRSWWHDLWHIFVSRPGDLDGP